MTNEWMDEPTRAMAVARWSHRIRTPRFLQTSRP